MTEQQPELVEISSGVQGVPPFLARYTIDTHHTPGYAAGYLANEVQPRLFMATHMPFDPYHYRPTAAQRDGGNYLIADVVAQVQGQY